MVEKNKSFLILVAMALLLSEITLSVNPIIGFISYSILIAGCLIALSKIEELNDYGKLIICLLIVPILRIAELFIEFEFLWRSFIFYGILLFLVLFYSVKFKIDLEFTIKKLWFIPFVILIGLFFGYWGMEFFDFEKSVFFYLLIPVIAFSEEVLFRGVLQNLTEKVYGTVSSMIFVSVLYFLFSISFGLQIACFFFCVSVITCLIYKFTKNLIFPILLSLALHFLILS